ncbi:LysR substrate-binding domain-containing protein [Streptomyces sp. NPDC058464]|uniref:LysR substrate-binding domain-containing protein n=1 Tax=Streptomyces sp. NPDC058464 TaxID=3346511 RepID=UPI00365D2BC4
MITPKTQNPPKNTLLFSPCPPAGGGGGGGPPPPPPHLSRSAPHIRLVLRSFTVESLSPPEVRTRDVDGLLAPQGFLPDDMPHLSLFRDRWVLVADAANTTVSDSPTLAELHELPWASAFEGPSRAPAGFDARQWAKMTERAQVVVDSFAAIPFCIKGTSRVALVQERYIHALGNDLGLRVLEPPFTIEPFELAFWWHPFYEEDPEHTWLRRQLVDMYAMEQPESAP